VYSQAELEAKLSELIAKHNVPGAQLAVLDGDEIVESAAGLLSLRTGCPTTTDALFLPGSIGKLTTATLVLLVRDGRLDLDTPTRYLRISRADDRLPRSSRRGILSPHQRLTAATYRHRTRRRRAGICGRLRRLPQSSARLIWSYSNSGYSSSAGSSVLHDDTFETFSRADREPLGLNTRSRSPTRRSSIRFRSDTIRPEDPRGWP
jgi:CubicO group peptidase (beta-lactamase class C family)